MMNRPAVVFSGRERLLREIVRGLLTPQPESFAVIGTDFAGKARLLGDLASDEGPLLGVAFAEWRPQPFQSAGAVLVARIDCRWLATRHDLLDMVCERLVVSSDGAALPSDVRSPREMIGKIIQGGRRPVVILDNFDLIVEDQLAEQDAKDRLLPLPPGLALVIAAPQPLHDLDQEMATSPFLNAMTQVFMGLVDADTAHTWIDAYAEQFPCVSVLSNLLLDLAGRHPFLLQRVEQVLAEVRQLLPMESADRNEAFCLIRLRLAEYGRPLFIAQWRMIQSPPGHIAQRVVDRLLTRLIYGPIGIPAVQPQEQAALNWLINQAMVTFGDGGYRLYSPLFTEYLAARLESTHAQQAAERTTLGPLPDLPIYQQLTKTEEALLRYFQVRSGKIVATEQLLADVWRRPDASPRRVQEAIRRLRLQLDGAEPPVGVIENERGRGYRFMPASGGN